MSLKASKHLRNVYITLGPYFNDKSSNKVFRVGATLDYIIESDLILKNKMIKKYENFLNGNETSQSIEKVSTNKDDFIKLMNAYVADIKVNEIRDYMVNLKTDEVMKMGSEKIKPEQVNLNVISHLNSLERKERNLDYLETFKKMVKLIKVAEQKKEDKGEQVTEKKEHLIKLMEKVIRKNDMGMEIKTNKSEVSVDQNQSRMGYLKIKKIKMKSYSLKYYRENCDRNYRNCKKATPKMLRSMYSMKTSSINDENNIWPITEGKPAIKLSWLKLVVKNPNGQQFEFKISKTNEYSYVGFHKGEPLNYHRIFIFFDITTQIGNLQKFSYEILLKNRVIKGPFLFESNVISTLTKPKIVSLGYHDDSISGEVAMNKLQSFQYDLLIIPGNIGLNSYEKNFKVLENYFDKMEDTFCRRPVIILPGEYESVDSFNMFNSKFQPLNLHNYRSMDMYHFPLNDISFYFLNLHIVVEHVNMFFSLYQKFLNLLEEVSLSERKSNKIISKRILVINEPIYCSANTLENEKCMKNLFLLKPFHMLARSFGIDIFLSGGTRFYERMELQRYADIRLLRKEQIETHQVPQSHQHENHTNLSCINEDVDNEDIVSNKNRVLTSKKQQSNLDIEDAKVQASSDKSNNIVLTSTASKAESLQGSNKHTLKTFFPVTKPLFEIKGVSYLINVGSAGYKWSLNSKAKMNNDSLLSKKIVTDLKGFVLLTFPNNDSRVFFLDFNDLEIQDFFIITDKQIKLLLFKYFFCFSIFFGFVAVCMYSNTTFLQRTYWKIKFSKRSSDFEFLLYQQHKIATEMKRHEEEVQKEDCSLNSESETQSQILSTDNSKQDLILKS